MNTFFRKWVYYYKRAVRFLFRDLWNLDFSRLSKMNQRFINDLKVLVITLKNYIDLRVGREAVSLSFYSTMAIVPMVAGILFVTSGLGLDEALSKALYTAFPTSTTMIDYVLQAAQKIISSLQNGLFGIISFTSFIWLVFSLMLSVEESFNRIWKVDKAREIWKRFLVYFGIFFLAPLLLLLFCYGIFYFTTFSQALQAKLTVLKFITTWVYWLVFYGLTVAVFSLVYKFVPHIKVHYAYGFKAAIVAAVAFVVVQYLYIETQMMVTRVGAVYGVLAAIPLFMVWMNINWQIILFGAELSYGFQKVASYDLQKEPWVILTKL